MKLVIQRVKKAKVDVEEKTVGKIGKGFLVFVGITHTDTKEEADFLAKKLCNLRVFEDNDNKMNLALKDVKGELLIISSNVYLISLFSFPIGLVIILFLSSLLFVNWKINS